MPGLSSGDGGGSGAVRAGRAFVELSLRGGGAVLRGFDYLKSKISGLGSALIKTGAVTGGIGASVVAAFKPALDALGETGKIADLADLFGITGEKASRLFGIMAAGGSDLRDAQEGLATFNQRVNDALTGKGEESVELFKQLRVNAQEFANLDTADRFYKLVEAVKASNSSLGPLNLLMKAVGEDTGKNLGGVLQMTAEQMRGLGDAFESSSADLKEAREATRAQATATAYLGKVWREIGVAIAPVVKDIAERFVAVAKPVAEFVKNNRELVATIFRIATTAVAVGAAMVTLGTIITSTGAGIGLFVSALGAIGPLVAGIKFVAGALAAIGAGPLLAIGAVGAGVGGLVYQFRDELGKAAQRAGDQVKDVFNDLSKVADTLKGSWGGVVAAVQSGDLALAGEIAIKTVELLWAEATANMTRRWNDFTGPVVNGWEQVTGGLGELFGAMRDTATGAFDALKRVGGQLAELFSVDGLRQLERDVLDALDGLVDGLGTRIGEAVAGIRSAIEGVRTTVSDLAQGLIPFVAPLAAPFVGAADLIRRAWEGTSSNLMENIINLVAWVDRLKVQVGDGLSNAFNMLTRTVLDAAIKITEVLDKLDPSDSLKGRLEELRGLRGGLLPDITDADTEAKLKKINDQRDRLIQDLRQAREDARKARETAGAADVKTREDAVARIKAELDELTARAQALQALKGAAGAIAAGANIPAAQIKGGAAQAVTAGSLGSFTALDAAQRFGGMNLQRQQLKKLVDIDQGIDQVVRAAQGIANGLTFK